MGMTEQEAIEILEKPSVHIKPVHKTENGMDFLSYSADLVEAFEMSIKALEKQIAKKPVGISVNEDNMRIANCPSCKKFIVQQESSVGCKHCLQRLDWRNEDDIGKSN